MEPSGILSFIILVCVIILGVHVTKHLKDKDERDRKLYEVMYNEARRASRISLECRMEIDNLSIKTSGYYEDIYLKQTEVIELLKNILPGEYNSKLSDMEEREGSVYDILQKVKIRQQYISDAIEKLEHIL